MADAAPPVGVREISDRFYHSAPPSVVPPSTRARPAERRRSGGLALALASDTARARRLRVQLGTRDEGKGLDRYEELIGRRVTERNARTETLRLRSRDGSRDIVVVGRIDGWDARRRAIVEHKRRVRGILSYVPMHERVQCHIYMRMRNTRSSVVVQTFGTHLRVDEVAFDPSVWRAILDELDASDCSSADPPTSPSTK